MLTVRNNSKLIAKFASAVLITNQIKYFIAILAIPASILPAMGFKKSQKKKFIIVIVADFKKNMTIKKLIASSVASPAFQ